jgi:excisionase family DNA binding protein
MKRTEQHDNATRLLYSRTEAARQLSISVRALDYLIANKTLNTRRKGKKVLIPYAGLVRYANSNDYQPFDRG